MKNPVIKFDEYEMRLIQTKDINAYYHGAFEAPDKEADYYTGTLGTYSKDQIKSYVEKIVDDKSRFDFLIWQGDEILGEVVINDIKDKQGHYRICIFNKENFSKGIGYRATLKVLEYVFDKRDLESITLEVFPFNTRGIGLYKKLGFIVQEEIIDHEAQAPYREIVVMQVTKSDFMNLLRQ